MQKYLQYGINFCYNFKYTLSTFATIGLIGVLFYFFTKIMAYILLVCIGLIFFVAMFGAVAAVFGEG